ncbi:MAG: IS5/IS1182 family transposase, partial [Nitrospirota bacterium]|nr:IS5/IS1182 family transposase [Nitrospirota bacterium]
MMQTTMRYQMKTKPLRIERFLTEMDQVVPWKQLEKVIQPHYKNTGGRPPHELRVM